MEQVFRVPVKSLVTTEEDEDEDDDFYDDDDEFGNGCYSYNSETDTDTSDPRTMSEDSPSLPIRHDHHYILKNCLEGSICHLFLPKKIPDCTQTNLVDIEVWLLQQCLDIFQELLQPFSKLHPVLKMFSAWRSSQPRNVYDRDRVAQRLTYELKNMNIGDTVPIYVRNQNSTIMFSKLTDVPESVSQSRTSQGVAPILVQTFRPCLPSETIMSTVGSIQMTFPETCDAIYNTSLLYSEVFAKQLHELAVEQFEVSMMTSTKADQEFVEHREVADPFLVTDWVVALLVPSCGDVTTPQKNYKIKKKIRDEVNCRRNAQALPFRRSGMWTSLKVTLHLKLLQMTGNEHEARLLYKCLILRILATTCQQYSERVGRGFSLDLAGQLIGKLGRRVRKLQKMTCDKNSAFKDEIVYLWSSTVKYVHTVVTIVHNKMTGIWKETCENPRDDLLQPIIRTEEEFKDDLLHIIPWLNKFILKERAASATFSKGQNGSKSSPPTTSKPSPQHTNSKVGYLERLERFYDFEAIMSSHEEITSQKQLRVWRHDIGTFIKFHLGPDTFENDTDTLMELAMTYIQEAYLGCTDSGKGRSNPVEFSQLVLATLRLIQILDQMAIAKFPLLSEYKSGINQSKFYKLLLPHSVDMKLLADILDYFQERDRNAKYPGLLDRLMEEPPETCFASRFASADEEMSKLRDKINQETSFRVKEKYKQVEKIRAKCKKLQQQLEVKKGTCEICKRLVRSALEEHENDNHDIKEITDKDLDALKCEECVQLEEEIESERYSVPVYEKSLPEKDHLQYAVIFELAIPDEIKNLRELIGLLKFDILREQSKKLGMNVQINWIDYRNLKKFRMSNIGETEPEFCHSNLSSKYLPTSTTHYTLIKNPDVLTDQDDRFIVPNGLDCLYHYIGRNFLGSLASLTNPLTRHCTFQVSTCDVRPQVDDEPYKTLQWALDTTTHSQNRIIAEFSSTHHPELIGFGSLRAGHRIQLMNLYRYIVNRQLQFEKEPVVALLLQTLYEVGPRVAKNPFGDDFVATRETKVDQSLSCWESHVDFMDLEFTEEFLELLEKFVENNDTNYANPLILLSIVVITVRILELNKSYRERCYKLLKKCRRCGEKWIEMIQNEISEKTHNDEQEDFELERNLKRIQLQIAIASALSYNVNSEKDEDLFHFVIQDGEDLMHWYETLFRLYELAPKEDQMSNGNFPSLSPFMKLLLELAQTVPLKLKLEEKLNSKKISSQFNDLLVKSLHLFGCMKWDWSAAAGTWKTLDDAKNIVIGRYQNQFLTFDMLQGEFLVNGFCLSGMPTSILQSSLYELYFRGTRKLKVVQVCYSDEVTPQGSPVYFRTSDKFHGKHYEFEVSSSGKVRIREVHEDTGRKLELLRPEKFRGFLGEEFVNQFTHWLEPCSCVVYLRRIPEKETDYLLHPEYKLMLDEKTQMWLVHDEIHDNFVFSRKSQGYQMILKMLTRLDREKYIRVLMKADGEVVAKLARHNLNFKLAPSGHLLSAEYKGFKVALDQRERGTLVGLHHAMLMINDETESDDLKIVPPKKLLLVPHGKIDIEQRHHHQLVRIDVDHLHQPSFFSYEFDPILKRLKGDRSKCAWLYLAALHGATSSCSASLQDSFTGLTGMEMAIQILQSGFVWSCSPYDLESLYILKTIQNFSPRREYYGHGMRSPIKLRSPTKGNNVPKNEESSSSWPVLQRMEQMETTEWPIGLSSIAAFDGYAIIVDRLVSDSNRLNVLYANSIPDHLLDVLEYISKNKGSSEKLQIRAYFRNLASYNKAGIINPNFFNNAIQTFNENLEIPEFAIRKRHKIASEEDKSKVFDIDFLLRMSQARFIMTLEEPHNGSKRKSGLTSFLLSPPEGQNEFQKDDDVLLPALPIPNASVSGVPIKDLLDSDFKQNWLKFFVMAVQWACDDEEKQAFSIVLNALAYQGAPIGQLLNLHNISVLSKTINFPLLHDSIRTCTFVDYTSEFNFGEQQLRTFLESASRTARDRQYHYHDKVYLDNHNLDQKEDSKKGKDYSGKLEMEKKIDEIVAKIKEEWPCEKISKKKLDELYLMGDKEWTNQDFRQINLFITKWYRNYQLKQFLENVESFLDKFYEHFPNIPKHSKQFDDIKELALELEILPPADSESRPFDHISSVSIEKEQDLDEPGVIFYSGSAFEETTSETLISTQREQCITKVERYMGLINSSICEGGTSKQIIFMSGLAPRTNPLLLLQYLIYGLRSPPGSINPGLLKLIGALAVMWTELKRFNRILSLIKRKNTSTSELKLELENPGHENWSPVDYPEWLILELELDIMIRPVQVDVAKQMMTMPDGKNGVMQLNMGEGKTSVIVPMLCVSLSNEQDSLCRVTVLNSIFKTNLNLLSFAIGGVILSRRVYTFPCSRDMKINLETLDKILECYQECLRRKGVVLTLPEYRLSFRSLAFDKTLKSYPEVGVRFLEIENGLRRYCREIFDESDEILNVKYQLVYTIGTQVSVDGGSLRWVTCQKLLQIVQDVTWIFLSKMGPTAVEFHKDLQQRHPEQFAHIRLLDESAHEEFLNLVSDELLKELKLTERQKQVVKKFLTQERISQENFKFVLSLFKNDDNLLNEIRLLSGYLRRGILALALKKRWRVEYGVNPSGKQYRKMAVPFRAKDFAAERTEFGHPDLAIILTHLSYYYSGLDDCELEECFEALKTKPEADSIYSSWIGRFLSQEKVPKFLSTFSTVNLQDAYQREILFSLLRKHKTVIDFWLSHKVFPEECKQFPGKIVMNAWDMCYEKQRLPITGFSGTNDSSILLPLSVAQQDLQVLQDTNIKMERALLQPENKGHRGLPMGVSCKKILEELKKDSFKVLIDAGALMLELNNEQVAQLWLETDPDIEAVVYFGEDNDILVKYRKEVHQKKKVPKLRQHTPKKSLNQSFSESEDFVVDNYTTIGSDTLLELSPYRDRLDKCAVFLDDQHTRGTDLKFPSGSRACVTIGSRMRRDKLMQACMRMRQLGSGHSVAFYLSHEAHIKVLKMKGNIKKDIDIKTEDILRWVISNTQESNREGLVYWALAGKNYAMKLAAQEFHDSVDTHPLEKIYTLSRQCVDDEVLTLKDMYGTYTEAELLVKLIPEWFEQTQRKLLSIEGCYSLSQRIMKRFDLIRNQIVKRCEEVIPDRTYLAGGFTAMEEEQEKELEHEREAETEEERQVVQESKVDYVRPSSLHENVRQTVLFGKKIEEKSGISKLSDIFERTSFSKLLQPEGWLGAEVYATFDFISVVKPFEPDDPKNSHFKTDSHLRPIEFVVSLRPQITCASTRKSIPLSPAPLQCLVLSPFEVNELMPYFRSGNAQTHLHMFSARNFQSQSLLLNNGSLQVPRPLTLQALNAPVLLNIIPDGSKCLAALLLASGNLYFGSMEEQKTFAKFLGLVPRPWTAEQMNAFEKEMIKKTGFLLPKFRRQEMDSCQIEQGAFQKDPIPLVRKILLCRHAVVSEVAHVSRLINHNIYIDLN